MAVREGRICGVPARLFRVSFTGELGYEINVPADHGRSVWEAVCEAGAAARHHALRHRDDARAARGEGLHHRRPGNRRHGDAATMSASPGRSAGTKPDFVGKRSLERAAMQAPDRKQLVGLRTRDAGIVLEEGAQIDGDAGAAGADESHRARHVVVCERARSAIRLRSRWSRAAARAKGRRSTCRCPRGEIPVTVTRPVFYDPEGARLHG